MSIWKFLYGLSGFLASVTCGITSVEGLGRDDLGMCVLFAVISIFFGYSSGFCKGMMRKQGEKHV